MRTSLGSRSFAIRYAIAAIGPFALAGSQFLLLLQLLAKLDAHEFGTVSFILLATQLCLSLSNALLCGPLAVAVNGARSSERTHVLQSFFSFNTQFCILAFVAISALAFLLGAGPQVALLFGLYAAFSMLRWFGRALFYANGNWAETVASDLTASIAILLGLLFIAHQGGSLDIAAGLLVVSSVLGLIPLGPRFILDHRPRARVGNRSGGYKEIWRQHSRWTLLGVLTTEATANAHAYIVTLANGPNAFAILAASALAIRPITVMMNALSDFERPIMARHIGTGDLATVYRSCTFVRWALVATWLITACAAIAVMVLAPRLLFPPQYNFDELLIGMVLWMLVALVRIMRMAESTALQAAGWFKQLASASVVSSGISIVVVAGIVATGNLLLSILGILAGEAVFAVGIWRRMSQWKASTSDPTMPTFIGGSAGETLNAT